MKTLCTHLTTFRVLLTFIVLTTSCTEMMLDHCSALRIIVQERTKDYNEALTKEIKAADAQEAASKALGKAGVEHAAASAAFTGALVSCLLEPNYQDCLDPYTNRLQATAEAVVKRTEELAEAVALYIEAFKERSEAEKAKEQAENNYNECVNKNPNHARLASEANSKYLEERSIKVLNFIQETNDHIIELEKSQTECMNSINALKSKGLDYRVLESLNLTLKQSTEYLKLKIKDFSNIMK